MESKDKSKLQEKIVRLYLRLNGFMTDGFIAHSSEHGKNLSETDVIGVRFPFHSEEEREVTTCNRLQLVEGKIHIIIGEVKSHGQKLQFNQALRGNIAVTRKVLNRIGFISPDQLDTNLGQIHGLFQNKNFTSSALSSLDITGTNYIVSSAMFKPETKSQNKTQSYFITGSDIFTFIWSCFRTDHDRCECATTYDFSLWGDFEEIVNYFKAPNRRDPGNMPDLYHHIEKSRVAEVES